MPEFYSLYSDDGLEVEEDGFEELKESDESDMLEERLDKMLDDKSMLLVVEEDDEEEQSDEVVVDEDDVEVIKLLVPGSEEEYVENLADDSVEVRETDWEDDGDHSKFVDYLRDKLMSIPRHSGRTVPGCERALAYLKNCEQEISKAMRSDLEGKIDEDQIDKIRREVYNMMDRLESQIQKLRKDAGVRVNFVSDGDFKDGLEKTAGVPVLNVYMTPFERAVVGTIINAKVSGGRHIEEVYEHLKNKYNFTPREEMALQQLLADHNYPIYKDRGLLNESVDPASGDNVEWQTNYYA